MDGGQVRLSSSPSQASTPPHSYSYSPMAGGENAMGGERTKDVASVLANLAVRFSPSPVSSPRSTAASPSSTRRYPQTSPPYGKASRFDEQPQSPRMGINQHRLESPRLHSPTGAAAAPTQQQLSAPTTPVGSPVRRPQQDQAEGLRRSVLRLQQRQQQQQHSPQHHHHHQQQQLQLRQREPRPHHPLSVSTGAGGLESHHASPQTQPSHQVQQPQSPSSSQSLPQAQAKAQAQQQAHASPGMVSRMAMGSVNMQMPMGVQRSVQLPVQRLVSDLSSLSPQSKHRQMMYTSSMMYAVDPGWAAAAANVFANAANDNQQMFGLSGLVAASQRVPHQDTARQPHGGTQVQTSTSPNANTKPRQDSNTSATQSAAGATHATAYNNKWSAMTYPRTRGLPRTSKTPHNDADTTDKPKNASPTTARPVANRKRKAPKAQSSPRGANDPKSQKRNTNTKKAKPGTQRKKATLGAVKKSSDRHTGGGPHALAGSPNGVRQGSPSAGRGMQPTKIIMVNTMADAKANDLLRMTKWRNPRAAAARQIRAAVYDIIFAPPGSSLPGCVPLRAEVTRSYGLYGEEDLTMEQAKKKEASFDKSLSRYLEHARNIRSGGPVSVIKRVRDQPNVHLLVAEDVYAEIYKVVAFKRNHIPPLVVEVRGLGVVKPGMEVESDDAWWFTPKFMESVRGQTRQ